MTVIIVLLIAHWIADFILQSRKDAEAKSHSLRALFSHVGSYSIFMTIVALFIYSIPIALMFGLITFVCHLITDFFTSKATTYSFLKTKETESWLIDVTYSEGDVIVSPEKRECKVINHYDGYYELIELKKYNFWMKTFWSIIGFDQLLHVVQLLLTNKYL